MAREVWSDRDVARACKDAVCLALYRYGKKRQAFPASDWVIRMDVLGYPQLRFLDGWARPLPVETRIRRTPSDVIRAVRRAVQTLPRSLKAPRLTLPAKLAHSVPEQLGKRVVDPDCATRSAAWLSLLQGRRWKTENLIELYQCEHDPVVRYAVIEKLAPSRNRKDAFRLLKIAIDGPNDYVREQALQKISEFGGKEAAAVLSRAIDLVTSGRCRWSNPNNMLCTALEVAAGFPDLGLVRPLERVIRRNDANNSATLRAVEALIAIGERHGMKRVRSALKRAEGLEGACADRIRNLVRNALRR